ncbi:MAG: hypothetical protein H0T85_04985 [Geodermatophilaceae bacterium]|nr:hypothetical protein [Geodermatophilaceae bacterium]
MGFPVIEDAAAIAQAGSGPITSWRARLQLVGDPVETFNAYLAQAQAAGYPVSGGCTVRSEDGLDMPLADFVGVSATNLSCGASYQRYSESNKSSTYVGISVEVGLRDDVYVSGVGLRYVRIGDGSGDEPVRAPLSLITQTTPVLPGPPAPMYAQPGDTLLPAKGDADLVLPDGVEQVGPSATSVVCSNGFDVVLATLDVAADVLARFHEQVKVQVSVPGAIRSAEVSGVFASTLTVNSLGGSNGLVITAADAGDDHYLLLSLC